VIGDFLERNVDNLDKTDFTASSSHRSVAEGNKIQLEVSKIKHLATQLPTTT